MVRVTSDVIEQKAAELAGSADQDAALDELVALVGDDRAGLEAARNAVAKRLHRNTGDWEATASLALLNRAVAKVGWVDPYDWRGRLGNRFRKP